MLVLVPRRADAKDGPALGDHVEGGDLLREQGRIPVGDSRHQRGELDAAGLRGEGRQRDVRLEHRLGLRADATNLIEVVHHGDEVEACGLGRLGILDHPVEQSRAIGAGEREVGHVKSEKQAHMNLKASGLGVVFRERP